MILKRITATAVTGCLLWNSAYANFAVTQKNAPKRGISAEEILSGASSLRGELTRALDDERIASELQKMGLQKSEVEMRLAAMSDRELQQIRDGVQRDAGGDVVVISVSTLLLIILVVLLIR